MRLLQYFSGTTRRTCSTRFSPSGKGVTLSLSTVTVCYNRTMSPTFLVFVKDLPETILQQDMSLVPHLLDPLGYTHMSDTMQSQQQHEMNHFFPSLQFPSTLIILTTTPFPISCVQPFSPVLIPLLEVVFKNQCQHQ